MVGNRRAAWQASLVTMTRRALLGLGVAIGASLAGCTRAARSGAAATSQQAAPTLTIPSGDPATGTAASSPSHHPATSAVPVGPARELASGPTTRHEIALTFHGAGDPAIARQLLAIFANAKAQVTVLAVGSWLAENPTIAREIIAGGHELGNHTYNHLDIDGLDPAAARAEIVRCRDLLRSQVGSIGAHFRPSQTQHASSEVLALAGAAGYPVALSYNVDSLDYTDPGSDAVRANVATAGAGSIVSMHFGHPGTVTAMPGVLADLKARGLTAVTASRLLRA
jgi:peptidoglycan/xylan/chitin deacetylase (PgdA/CDA1 family)